VTTAAVAHRAALHKWTRRLHSLRSTCSSALCTSMALSGTAWHVWYGGPLPFCSSDQQAAVSQSIPRTCPPSATTTPSQTSCTVARVNRPRFCGACYFDFEKEITLPPRVRNQEFTMQLILKRVVGCGCASPSTRNMLLYYTSRTCDKMENTINSYSCKHIRNYIHIPDYFVQDTALGFPQYIVSFT
jgi:hypothetical protein